MDQDHSDVNGQDPSFQDRLGIEDEGAEPTSTPITPPRPTSPRAPVRAAPRAPVMPGQYGAKPGAPTAPRAPATGSTANSAVPSLAPRMPSFASRNAPASSRDGGRDGSEAPPPAGSTLAERLRVQRENAERLAEQRLALARQRAAARQAEQDSARTKREAAEVLARVSEDEVAARAPTRSLATPRAPMISADRLQLATRKPAEAPRPPTSAAPMPARPQTALAPKAPLPPSMAPRAPQRPAEATPMPALPMPSLRVPGATPKTAVTADANEALVSAPSDVQAQTMRAAPRAPVAPRAPIAPRQPAPAGDDDLFVSEGGGYTPPKKSIGQARPVRDEFYAQGQEATYGEASQPSRRLPILAIILALAAILVLGGAWYVFQAVTDTGSNSALAPAEVPVVPAPAEPIKVEGGADNAATTSDQPASGTKQIYDRILGEGEQANGTETISPSEETPVAPIDTGALPIPQPPSVEPMAPPPEENTPADQSGAMDSQSEPIATAPEPVAPPPAANVSVPSEQDSQQLAALLAAETPAAIPAPKPPVPGEVVNTDAGAPVVAPQKVISILPKPRPAVPESFLASQQLTPPEPQQGTVNFGAAPSSPSVPVENVDTNSIAAAPPPGVSGPQTIAPALIGTGYVAQLANFKTRDEANSEYRRIRDANSSIIGSLSPIITQSDLGVSGTIYRLGLGPLASKDAASQLCQQLIAAGEKDCIVRRQ